MPTIKAIQHDIDTLTTKAQAETNESQKERMKGEQAQAAGDMTNMKLHLDTATRHDQLALQYQNQVADRTLQMQQIQKQIEKLTEERTNAQETFTQEIARYDGEIARLQG